VENCEEPAQKPDIFPHYPLDPVAAQLDRHLVAIVQQCAVHLTDGGAGQRFLLKD